ncbi:MAG: BlaI/MecI/CopY family transcriptional regulator [Bacteroidota bacterium]
MKLSKTEEQLMQYLWSLEKAFMKDLLDAYPDPKPATTTVATLLKRMTTKGFVAYTLYGKSREYYPLVKKEDYFSSHMNQLIKQFFNNSASQFASFFTSRIDMSTEELEELRKLIDDQIKKQEE